MNVFQFQKFFDDRDTSFGCGDVGARFAFLKSHQVVCFTGKAADFTQVLDFTGFMQVCHHVA